MTTPIITPHVRVVCPECGKHLHVSDNPENSGYVCVVPTHKEPESREVCSGSGTWENAF